MYHFFCKSKLNGLRVTEAQLRYEGSITIDSKLLKAAKIVPGEKVEVLNLNNGSRLETYAIAAKAGSGCICLNGPAARSGQVGDEIIILCYILVDGKELKKMKTKVIKVDAKNRIKNIFIR